eukprot:COSAG06_NODE_9887_length_1796_cov_1.800825_2_plen_235_part_01
MSCGLKLTATPANDDNRKGRFWLFNLRFRVRPGVRDGMHYSSAASSMFKVRIASFLNSLGRGIVAAGTVGDHLDFRDAATFASGPAINITSAAQIDAFMTNREGAGAVFYSESISASYVTPRRSFQIVSISDDCRDPSGVASGSARTCTTADSHIRLVEEDGYCILQFVSDFSSHMVQISATDNNGHVGTHSLRIESPNEITIVVDDLDLNRLTDRNGGTVECGSHPSQSDFQCT